jgi:hypothetical protein
LSRQAAWSKPFRVFFIKGSAKNRFLRIFSSKIFQVKPGEKFHDDAVVALAVFWIDSDQRRAFYPVLYHHLVWPRSLFCGALSVFISGIFPFLPIVYMDFGVINTHLSLVPGPKTQNGGQNHGRNVAGSHTRWSGNGRKIQRNAAWKGQSAIYASGSGGWRMDYTSAELLQPGDYVRVTGIDGHVLKVDKK